MPRDAVTGEAEVDVREGRRLLERWRDYTLRYANNDAEVTSEEWEEAAKEAEDWAVENGLALIRRADRLEERVRELEAALDQYRRLAVDADHVARTVFEKPGLCDAVDNDREAYPSEWGANLVAAAKRAGVRQMVSLPTPGISGAALSPSGEGKG